MYILEEGFILLVFGGWSLVFGRRSLASGLWSLEEGLWLLVFGLWRKVLGRRSLASGLWSLEEGLWVLVFGCWSLFFGEDLEEKFKTLRKINQRLIAKD
jgi:hypothetical protein